MYALKKSSALEFPNTLVNMYICIQKHPFFCNFVVKAWTIRENYAMFESIVITVIFVILIYSQ